MSFDKQRRNSEYLKDFPIPDSRSHTFHKSLQKHVGQKLNAGSLACLPSSLDLNHSHMENRD